MPLSSLSAVLAWHCGHYPLLRAQDIYKLIHQGVFGPGHIIASAAGARRALEGELTDPQAKGQKPKGKSQKSDEALLEPIDQDGRLVRVNLRPMLREVRREKSEGRNRGRSEGERTGVDWLADALVESARRVKGNPERMKRRLSAAVRWCRANLPRQAAELERTAAQAEESGFPAFHHSPAYARAYRPAYRVILRACLDRRVSSSQKGRTKREARRKGEVRSQNLEARFQKCRKPFCALASCFSLLASSVLSAVPRVSGRAG